MKYLFLDTETTGLDAKNNSILEIAAVVYDENKNRVDVFNVVCKPFISSYNKVSLAALKVNNTFCSDLKQENRMSEQEAVEKFLDFLITLNKKEKDITLCGMNVNFDINFLKEAASRYGYTDVEAVLPRKIIDTQVIAQALIDVEIIDAKSAKSEVLYDYFGISLDKIHSALFDCQKTAELYFNNLAPILKG